MKKMTDAQLVDLAKRAIALIKEGNEQATMALVNTIPVSQRAYFYVSLQGAVVDKKAKLQSK